MDWELTDEEKMNLIRRWYNSSFPDDTKYLISLGEKAAQKKLLEWIISNGHSSRDTWHFEIDMDDWQALKKGVGL